MVLQKHNRMVLEENDYDEQVTSEEDIEKGIEYSNDPHGHIRILFNFVAIAVIVFIFLVVYCVPQVFLMSFGYKDSQSMVGTVVSPFDSIVREYSPKSSKPCVYSTLENHYKNTYVCNCKYLY